MVKDGAEVDKVTTRLRKTVIGKHKSPTPERGGGSRSASSAAGRAAATAASEAAGAAGRADDEEMEEEDEDVLTVEELTTTLRTVQKRLREAESELDSVRATGASNTRWIMQQGVEASRRSLMLFAQGGAGKTAEERMTAARKHAREAGITVLGVDKYGASDKVPVEVAFGSSADMKQVLRTIAKEEGIRAAPKIADALRMLDSVIYKVCKDAPTHHVVRSWLTAQPITWVLVETSTKERGLTVQLKGDTAYFTGPLAQSMDKAYGRAEEEDDGYALPWRGTVAAHPSRLADNQLRTIAAVKGKGAGKGKF